jgi:hypothetical protein
MAVFHRMAVPFETSQLTGRLCPSATPDAEGPRKEGQFCAAAVSAMTKGMKRTNPAYIFFSLSSA